MNRYAPLFEPFKIADLEIKNRFVMCAMGGVRLYNHNGAPVDEAVQFYTERARGGVGLIVTRALVVLPVGLDIKLYDHPELFEPLRNLTDSVHEHGCKIFLQLSGGAGRTVHQTEEQIEKLGIKRDSAFFAPSDGIPNVWYPEIKHRGLTKEEIKEYINAFGKMSLIARNLGFDGVEVHAIHEGYLLDQFTVECTNHRTDEYGGSIENRFRMVCEIVERIKNTCGKCFPVSVRYSITSKMKGFNNGALPGEDYKEFGRNIEEGIRGAQLLEQAGVDMLDCDNGSYDSWFWPHPPVYMPNCCNLEEAAIVKQHIGIPVVCAGKMDLPEDALCAVTSGKCDGVGIARAFLVDPEYVNKIMSGELSSIKPCIGCHNGCLAEVASGKPLSCALNPKVLHESAYRHILPTEQKRIAIIGAGIAGIEAALLLEEYGHKVTIYEKHNTIGGNYIRAAELACKERDNLLLEWYRYQLEKRKIEVKFNCEILFSELDSLDADIVILAPGAVERPLQFKKQHERTIRVETYLDNHDIVTDKVLIVGGGLTAVEAALDMNAEGRQVTMVVRRGAPLERAQICEANRQFLIQSLKASGIHILHSTTIVSAEKDKVVFKAAGKCTEQYLGEYTIVEATGYEPRDINLQSSRINRLKKIYVIGDAKKVGNVCTAVKDAYNLVLSLCI